MFGQRIFYPVFGEPTVEACGKGALVLINNSTTTQLTRSQFFALAVCSLGLSIDLVEVALGSVLSTVLSATPNPIRSDQLSFLLAAVYVGAIIGAPLFGSLADIYGRRTMFVAVMSIMTIASLGAGLSQGIGQLTAFRALAGLALGAYPPLLFAYLSEILPPAKRGMMVMIVVAVANLGPPATLVAISWLTSIAPLGVASWRWAFLAAGAAAGICGLMFCLAPESPPWLQSGSVNRSPRKVGAQNAIFPSAEFAREWPPAGHVPTSRKQHRRRLAFALLALFLPAWAIFGFPLLSGPALLQKGIDLRNSLLYVGVAHLAPVIGTVLGSMLVDRFDRRAILAASAMTMAIFGMLYAIALSPSLLILSGTSVALASSVLLPILTLYVAELFETERRAGAVSMAWASSRVSSALMTFSLVPILLNHGPLIAFSVTSGMLLAFAAILLIFGPSPKMR